MLTVIWALSVIAVLSGIPIKSFAIYSSIGGLVIFVPVMIASVMLKKKMPEAWKASKFKVSTRVLIACVVVGILFFAAASVALFGELWKSDRFMFWFFFVLVAVGIGYYLIMRRRVGARETGSGPLSSRMP
jgi:L-asparagine transporter-like permease